MFQKSYEKVLKQIKKWSDGLSVFTKVSNSAFFFLENYQWKSAAKNLTLGNSYFSINGMQVDLTSQWGDPFQLLETVRGELDTMERLV